MPPRICLVALFVVTSALRAFAAPHPSLPPPVIPDCLGVNIHFTKPQLGEMEMLAKAGFKWVRMDLAWAETERKRGEYDFSAYDGLVAELDKHKIRALFILDYGNPLYAEPGDKQPFTSRAHTPEFREAFAKWAVAAVKHFAGRGYLWELWNEPNIEHFWKSPNGREDYVALAKTTGEALRAAKLLGEKGEAFIGPACSKIDLPFLEACFKAGLLEYWDAVSVHPYRQGAPETAEAEYRAARLLIHRHAPKDKAIPLISGEWGYSSVWKDFDEQKQAQYLPRQFLTNMANDVALSIWYDWRDDGTDPKNSEHHFGLVGNAYAAGRNPVYQPRPAYQAMKTLIEQLGGFAYNKDLTEMSYGGRSYAIDNPVLLFTRGVETRLATWRGGQGDERVQVGASPGKFKVTDINGLSQILEVKSSGGLRTNAREEVQYLVPERPNRLLQVAAAWRRLPLESTAQAPTSIELPDELVNPLDSKIGLPGWQNPEEVDRATVRLTPPRYRTEHEIAEGMATARTEGAATLAPNARITRVIPQNLQRANRQSLYGRRLDVTDAGISASFFQHSHLVPLNPLEFVLLPGGPKFFPLMIKNPSGEAMEGEIVYWQDDGDVRTNIARGAFVLAAGETEKIVRIDGLRTEVDGTNLSFNGSFGRGGINATAPRSLWLGLTMARVVADGAPDVGAEGKLEPSLNRPPSETETVRLQYRFDAGWKFLRLIAAEDFTVPRMIGLWIHGDAKGCQTRVRFTDSTGQTFQSNGPKIDWQGWRFVTFPLCQTADNSLSSWGGAQDGKIHFPVKCDTLLLLDNVSRQKLEGEILISAPSIVH